MTKGELFGYWIEFILPISGLNIKKKFDKPSRASYQNFY